MLLNKFSQMDLNLTCVLNDEIKPVCLVHHGLEKYFEWKYLFSYSKILLELKMSSASL